MLFMIRWNDIWKEKATASGMIRSASEDFNGGDPIWEWWSMPGWWEDGRRRAASIEANASWTALEIGPGPGIVTIPLAKRVRSVTAIEPASSMIAVLEREARAEQLTNISIIRTTWERVLPEDVRGHDIVVASDSLFFADIGEAIRKMNLLARRKVHLFWMSEMPTWERIRAELWPRIHGTQYIPIPKADVLFNALHEMGMYPEYRIVDPGQGNEPRFSDIDQAMSYLRSCIGSVGREYDETIREYANERLRADGSLVAREVNTYAWISWSPLKTRCAEAIDWNETWR